MMSCVTSIDGIKPNSRKQGQIQVIFGPMFSGKTTELIRRMKRYQIANYDCLLIKYDKDTRYDKHGVATHDNQVCKATAASCLSDIYELAEEAEVIGIDEGQFFPDCVKFCERMANVGKVIIVAALDGTFQRKGFGDILNLVPLAESVIKLNAVCMRCYNEASYTKRLGYETELEVIGGADKYMAVCRLCHQLSPSKFQDNSVQTPVTIEASQKCNKQGRRLFVSPSSDGESSMSP
ncbi:thymidine kinase, cytosolic-like [Diadema setosum]|uniref:thymidine kinase, cytosolic-like n=1 Tax=Diadema setosum TaxID=31175 RepID=UPI003B3BDD0F